MDGDGDSDSDSEVVADTLHPGTSFNVQFHWCLLSSPASLHEDNSIGARHNVHVCCAMFSESRQDNSHLQKKRTLAER